MNLSWIIEENTDLPVTGESHLKNHLNYLFRTDRAQKWTNERTPDNVLVTVQDLKQIRLGDYDNRILWQMGMVDSLDRFYKKVYHTDDWSELIYGTLHMFCLFLYDSDTKDVLSDVTMDMFEPDDVVRKFKKVSSKICPSVLLSLVLHQDQDNNPPHVHGLYYTPKAFREASDTVCRILA